MPIPNAISISQLYRLVGTRDCPVVVDVRIPEDFDDDPRIIPGAIKRDFDNIDALAEEFPTQSLVIYCQKGLKISQGTAALLRQAGVTAMFLEGGQFAWRDEKLPMVTATSIPRDTNESESLWVTRHRPKIDRIACPWLIRRFVDPKAKLLFVEPSQVMNVTDRFNATPFDIEDVKFSHRGELCSFDTMLEEFGLNSSEPLNTLAQIVRGADTNRHDLAPEAAGLLAISVGLSRMYRDDLEQLEAGMLIYDAYYRWARDAKDEEHDHDWSSAPNPEPYK
jgi:rhodanese-related sulfurtransferase